MDTYLTIADRQTGATLAREMEAGGSFTVAVAPSVSSTLPARSPAAKPVPPKPAKSVAVAATPVQPLAPQMPSAPPPPKIAQVAPKPAPTPLPAPKTPPSAAVWKIQLGAYGSEAGAQKAWNDISRNAAVRGKAVDYIPVGALTRLRAGPFPGKAEASQACQALVKTGFNCFPVAP
jgi:DedD protein